MALGFADQEIQVGDEVIMTMDDDEADWSGCPHGIKLSFHEGYDVTVASIENGFFKDTDRGWWAPLSSSKKVVALQVGTLCRRKSRCSDSGSDCTELPESTETQTVPSISSSRTSSEGGSYPSSPMHSKSCPVRENVEPEAAPAEAPSIGSVLHSRGTCEPCAWFHKPQGCDHGKKCHRCHLCPEGTIKARRAAKLATRRAAQASPVNPPTTSNHPEPSRTKPPPPSQAPPPPPPSQQPFIVAEQQQCPPPPLHTATIGDTDQASLRARYAPASIAASPPGLPMPSITETARSLSVGSALHYQGKCEPCAWYWKPQGCQNGLQCSRCHLCPEDEVKTRKVCKRKALKATQVVEKQLSTIQITGNLCRGL